MRMIDGDALEERIKVEGRNQAEQRANRYDNVVLAYGDCFGMVRDAPTIDAVPVVRGEWLVTDAYPHRVYCSVCYKTNVPNEEWLFEKNEYPHFCMWCGAKMEVEHE